MGWGWVNIIEIELYNDIREKLIYLYVYQYVMCFFVHSLVNSVPKYPL